MGCRVAQQQPLGHEVVHTDPAGQQHRVQRRASDWKSTQKGPGTVVQDPSANNGPQSDASIKEVKDERPGQ